MTASSTRLVAILEQISATLDFDHGEQIIAAIETSPVGATLTELESVFVRLDRDLCELASDVAYARRETRQ